MIPPLETLLIKCIKRLVQLDLYISGTMEFRKKWWAVAFLFFIFVVRYKLNVAEQFIILI